MLIVNIHDAKTRLSKLIARTIEGESFIIAKAGKPVAKVIPFNSETETTKSRLGGLVGKMGPIPDDFDTMFRDEIEAMFYGKR